MEHQRETQVRTPDDPEILDRNQESAPAPQATLHPVLQLQQDIGNRAVQRLLADGGTPIQPKLTIGAADDQLEHEADRVAQDVVTSPAPPSSVPNQISAQPQVPEENQTTKLSSDEGSPLPESSRAFMEPRFGLDFNRVRLHAGSEAAGLNRSIGAQAFTHGQDIYLGEGSGNLES